jgi:outer membrane protein assembly factor BamB
MLRLFLPVFFFVLGAASPMQAQDWPRFRGPNGSGVSQSTGLPVEFGPAKNLLWKATVPFARSSPVVAGDRVYLTATEGEKLITLALDRRTGKPAWRTEIQRARAMSIYKANDGASPSPATDGKNVYAFFPELGLVSFDAKGKERWRAPLGPFDSFYGLAASPVFSGNTVLLLCDARSKPFIVAVDARSGKVRWRHERKEIRFEGYTSPIVYEPPGQPAQMVVLGPNRVDAFAVETGEHLWWVRGLAFYPIGSPVMNKDTLVVSTSGTDAPKGPTFDDVLKSDGDKDGKLTPEEMKPMAELYEHFAGIDTNGDGFIERGEWDFIRNGMAGGKYGLVGIRLGGRGDLTDTAVLWNEKKTYPTMPTPLVYNDVLYIVKTGGIIASLNPASGETHKVGRTEKALGEYYASPVAADGKLIFVSEAGVVTVARAQPQWEILAVNDLGEESFATPAIAGNALFIRTRNALYSFGKK